MPSKPGERQRRPLKWDEKQLHALYAVFEGKQTRVQIAQDCETPPRTLDDWIAHPEFQARLKTMRDRVLETLDELGVPYVRKEQRLMGLSAMAVMAREDFEAHRVLREYRPVLVKRQQASTGDGNEERSGRMQTEEDYIITERWNEAAHAGYRQALADIAAELGARKNVTELTGKGGEALPGLVINLPPITEQTQAKYMRRGAATASEDTPEGGESDGPAGAGLS